MEAAASETDTIFEKTWRIGKKCRILSKTYWTDRAAFCSRGCWPGGKNIFGRRFPARIVWCTDARVIYESRRTDAFRRTRIGVPPFMQSQWTVWMSSRCCRLCRVDCRIRGKRGQDDFQTWRQDTCIAVHDKICIQTGRNVGTDS